MLLHSVSTFVKRCWHVWFYLLLGLIPLTAQAWDDTGHRLIASIAYTQLTPHTREIVDQLTQLTDPNYPPLARFTYGATLPDQWRKIDSRQSSWHFVNYPWSTDNTPIAPGYSGNLIRALQKKYCHFARPSSHYSQKSDCTSLC